MLVAITCEAGKHIVCKMSRCNRIAPCARTSVHLCVVVHLANVLSRAPRKPSTISTYVMRSTRTMTMTTNCVDETHTFALIDERCRWLTTRPPRGGRPSHDASLHRDGQNTFCTGFSGKSGNGRGIPTIPSGIVLIQCGAWPAPMPTLPKADPGGRPCSGAQNRCSQGVIRCPQGVIRCPQGVMDCT